VSSIKYVKKANSGSGGVGYEKMIVTSELLSNINAKSKTHFLCSWESCEYEINTLGIFILIFITK
jgi:hypothetical protein